MKKYLLIFPVIAAFVLGACNDDFLEKYPIESQTEATAFKTNENFRTYAWSFYSVFNDYNNFVQGIDPEFGRYNGDWRAGYLSVYSTTEDNPYRNNTAQAPSSGGGWNFSFIRRVCLLLDNVDKSEMVEKDKAHWRSVGYFFHSYNYMELVSRFGDVPWVDKVLGETDVDLIYGTRTSRIEVTNKILERLLFAENNIKAEGDGDNTINKNVVRAFISRFCLFEGTWRKYHGLGDYEKFLNEAIRVSEELMKVFPQVNSDYDKLMCSEDLSTYTGIILYKEYVKDLLTHTISQRDRSNVSKYEMHKATAEMYLCSDGKTISNSALYAGDETMYHEFRNRDRRLILQVVPPYFMATGLNQDFTPNSSVNSTKYHANVDPFEYVELMKQILPNNPSKRLPVFNWSGTMNWTSPNVIGPGQAPIASRSGYHMWRHYTLGDSFSNMAAVNTFDKPIFYIEEVLLNYAEAMFEMGRFSQTVADLTINKLRKRAAIADMNVSEIDDSFDPKRDVTVDPVLWEIRRERLVELMGEGFGFQDVRRWKTAAWFVNQDQMGVRIKKSDYTNAAGVIVAAWNNLKLVDRDFNPVNNEGYLQRFINPVKIGKGWKDQYYLFPIPLNDLSLNENLEQNPGWN
ncbi:RagB/SusD family nutrient uptake outer membrane protein [Gaoshiqia sp. Z1-71]|uniref:RagB/SusD family nutrient uptake outer membrane protein n=1 Tax=Gaoshiqia hydrogeniformans TaxID=3290090 RepID=UPI003BF91E7D